MLKVQQYVVWHGKPKQIDLLNINSCFDCKQRKKSIIQKTEIGDV
jgi:hypothetical protein